MTIVRAPRDTAGWFTIPNQTVRDTRLSLRAVGLLCHLLSNEPGWKVNSHAIAKQWNIGRDAVRAVLQELIRAGYAVRHRWQDEGGHWHTDTVVFDCPQSTVENPQSYPPPTPDPPVPGDSGRNRNTKSQNDKLGFIGYDTLKGIPRLCGQCRGNGVIAGPNLELTDCPRCNGEGLALHG